MADKVDMSLDDIIKSNRSAFRSGRGGPRRRGGNPGARKAGGAQAAGRNGNLAGRPRRAATTTGAGRKFAPRGGPLKKANSGAFSSDRWQHDKFRGALGNGAARNGSGQVSSSKLTISNLDYGVSDADVKELFTEFGPLKKAAVHYDRSGRSLGTADVVFERRTDALRALKQYNDVPLDGRPMKIELVNQGTNVPTGNRVLAGRIGKKTPVVNKVNQRGARAIRGGRRVGGRQPGRNNAGGARPGGRNPAKVAPTKEQLDAELDDYVSKIDKMDTS